MPTPYICYHQLYHNIHAFGNDESAGKQDLAKGKKSVSKRGTSTSIRRKKPNTGTPAMVKIRQCVSDREMDAILDEEFNAQHSKNAYDPLPIPLSAGEKKLRTSASFKEFSSEKDISSSLARTQAVAASHGQDHGERRIYSNTMTASPIDSDSEFPTNSDTSVKSKKKNSGRKIVVDTTSTTSVDSMSRDQDTFNERLEMLREFKKSHGHTHVPSGVV